MPEIGLGIDDLELDLQNPRIAKGSADQREALLRIISAQGSKLVSLAADIVENGLNPMDRLLVVGSENGGGKYTVLEGNRRIVALKVLNNPAVLADLTVRPAIRARLETLASGFDPEDVEPVACYEVASRAEGERWIEQRHTGENAGRGIVGWNATAAARFQSRDHGRDPALQALDFVLEHGRLTEAQKEALGKARLITTLRRILDTRDARTMLGFEVKNGRLITSLPDDKAVKPLKRIVLDLAARRINVNDVYYKDDIVRYVSDVCGGDTPDQSQADGDPRPSGGAGSGDDTPPTNPPAGNTGGNAGPAGAEATGAGGKPPGQPASPKRTPGANPRTDRPNLIPRSLRLNITITKLNEIYRELKSLSLTEHRYAVSVLFRVFFENSVDHYLSSVGIETTKIVNNGRKVFKKLDEKVSDAVKDLVNKGADRTEFEAVIRALSVEHNPLYIDLLHAYVHNRFVLPLSRDLAAAWNNAEPFLQRIWR